MTTRVLAATSPGEVRVAAVRNGMLVDYALWRPGRPDGVGDVHRGRLIARVPAMAGCFVALADAEGFLPDSESGSRGAAEGEAVLVRITRAAQGGKGPRLSSLLPDAATLPTEAGAAGPPVLLRSGPTAVERFAAMYPDAPVLTDDATLLGQLRPLLPRGEEEERISLAQPVFDEWVEEEAAGLAEASVSVTGGAVLHIHPTPALVAIDADAGRTTSVRQPKAEAQLSANRALLPDLARQIRLRNLSGAILVDLAGLSPRRRGGLGPAIAAALADDPLRPRFLGFTALGLAEILRPRVHPPLHELLHGPHAAGLAALRRIAADNLDQPHRAARLRASPVVVAALQANSAALPDLARRTGRPLSLASDPSLPALGWIVDYE